jgi:pilus assembly protein Flp/PilA
MMKLNLKHAVWSFLKEEDGATMVEYGLMVALIAVVCLAAVSSVGDQLKELFTTIAGKLKPSS